jgi:ATP-binding cassette subfamily F protein 3
MLLRPSNLLLMDEPTNHLDLFSKEVLLDALKSFDGTVVFVSHDRYFVNGLATRIIEVEGGGVENYYGDYEYYLTKKEGSTVAGSSGIDKSSAVASALSALSAGSAAPAPLPALEKEERKRGREEEKQRKREDEKRLKRLGEIEREIARTESEIARLETEMGQPGFFDDLERGAAAGERHSLLNEQLEKLYGEWEGLSG